MSDAEPSAPEGQDLPVDPWDRFGWLMSVIWLVFLGFPLHASATADLHPGLRVLAVAIVVAFAGAYVLAFLRLGDVEGGRRSGWTYLAVLVALAAGSASMIGLDAGSTAPFVVAYAMFAVPVRAALVVLAAAVGTVAVGVVAADEPGAWVLVGIVLLVGAIAGIVRQLEERGEEHRRMAGDLAMVAERERVARDVHDVLGHSLTVVTVKAELAERLVDEDPDAAKAELAEIRSLTRQALAEIRATVGGLRVARLADELDAGRTALEAAGIEARLPSDVSVVDPRHRIVLAWALREAITNVMRHSGASTCTVELGPASLTVCDDGRGLRGHAEGNGLRGVRERVTAAGGSVAVADGPDGGTVVEVTM